MFQVSWRVISSIVASLCFYDHRSEELVIAAVAACDPDARVLGLMGAGTAPDLQRNFSDADHCGDGDCVGTQRAARRVDRQPAAQLELAFAQHRDRLTGLAEAGRVDRMILGVAERRVEFGDMNLSARI